MPDTGAIDVLPRHRRFTVDEYHRMAEAGILHEGDRVELIDGEVYEMAPIGSRHAACVRRLNELFGERLRRTAIVAVQDPVRLSQTSEPQPDIALLRRREDRYAAAHPGPEDIFLIVEVGDSSAAWDRERKVPAYASAGVPEVWLVDLEVGVLEAYRHPQRGAYAEVERHGHDGTVSPAAFPEVSVLVADLLA